MQVVVLACQSPNKKKVISCNAGCYFNGIMYKPCNHDMCMLALTANAMQYLLDVCYDCGIEYDILFNPITSVGTVFKPMSHKLYFPTVFIVLMR